MSLSVASRWVLMLATVLALAGCASSSAAATASGSPAATLAPPPPSASTPAGTPSATVSAPASGGTGSGAAGDTIQLSAQGIQFSTNQLQAPAGRAFSIEFQNNDAGIAHNVDILDASNTSIFKAAIFPGVATQTYQVPAMKAGTYSFICDVHPNIMTGTLTVQ